MTAETREWKTLRASERDTFPVKILESEITRIEFLDCAHRASILRSKIDARPWAISINHAGCDREKVFLDFLDLARAHRGLFRRCSQQGVQNGPRPPRYAYCRSRGGCRRSATAEVWLRRASVRPPD